jgi:hypothetical protein
MVKNAVRRFLTFLLAIVLAMAVPTPADHVVDAETPAAVPVFDRERVLADQVAASAGASRAPPVA